MSEGPNKSVRNERLKLRATALNSIAVASVVAGFITPLAALTFGLSGMADRWIVVTFAAMLAWLALGGILHAAGSFVLGGLRE